VEQKRAYKSFRYKAKTTWSNARRGILSAEARHDIVVGSPPEFKGKPDNWAPEELLVGALNTCTMLTFLALAEARDLRPVEYESEAEGQLENIEGNFQITKVVIRPHVTVRNSAELEPAQMVMDSVKAQCFIANSIRAAVTLVPEFLIASATEL
jgi:organic hydroperoxide reductase OsmC/OhrA